MVDHFGGFKTGSCPILDAVRGIPIESFRLGLSPAKEHTAICFFLVKEVRVIFVAGDCFVSSLLS